MRLARVLPLALADARLDQVLVRILDNAAQRAQDVGQHVDVGEQAQVGQLLELVRVRRHDAARARPQRRPRREHAHAIDRRLHGTPEARGWGELVALVLRSEVALHEARPFLDPCFARHPHERKVTELVIVAGTTIDHAV